MDTFNIYVQFPKEMDRYITSAEEGNKLIKHIQIILDRVDCENGAELFYDSKNRDEFFDEIKIIFELIGFVGTLSAEEVILHLLEDSGAYEWTSNPSHEVEEVNTYYKYWVSENREASQTCPPILKEVTDRASKDTRPDSKYLVLNLYNTLTESKYASVIKGLRDEKPHFLYVDLISDFIGLEDWYFINRTKRVYNFSDNRHIENHPEYIRPKSPILGGKGGKINISVLLDAAIGDRRQCKWLINYDLSNNCYVRFESENSDSYHGYHLVRPISHERDIKAERLISPRIIDILNYRKSLEEAKGK